VLVLGTQNMVVVLVEVEVQLWVLLKMVVVQFLVQGVEVLGVL
jgi:hypothetical protein